MVNPAVAAVCLPTARLRVVPVDAFDIPAVFRLYSDREVMRYWSNAPWTALEQAVAWFNRTQAHLAAGDALQFVINEVPGGQFVGTCTLFDIDLAHRRAEVGYALLRSAWGRGLMQEAMMAVLDHGFDALGLHRVEADIDPANLASARVLQRLGFRQEGLLRERWQLDGRPSDSAIHGLLEDEWRGRRAR